MEWQQYHKNFTFKNHLGRNSLDNHKLVTKTVANNNSGTGFACRLEKSV